MNIKNNAVDDILKRLADYKPQAKPDWDSFYADYQNQISDKTDKKPEGQKTFSAGMRTGIAIIVALSAFVAAYFLLFNSNTSNAPATNQTQITPINTIDNSTILNTTILPENNSGNSTDKMFNSSELPANNLLKNKGAETGIGSSSGINNTTLPVIIEPTSEKSTGEKVIEISTRKNENTSQLADSLNKQPVLIKKTVIITDTIRVTRPQKK